MIRLMIVDDETLLRQGFKHMTDWESLGYQVVGEAANGEEAMNCIEECNPDIVITDIRMPVMDGMQFTRLLRERYPEKIVVVLSSYSNFDYARDTLRNGAVDYVLKPELDLDDMLGVLKAAAQRIPESLNPQVESRPEATDEMIFRRALAGDTTALLAGRPAFGPPLPALHLVLVLFEIDIEPQPNILFASVGDVTVEYCAQIPEETSCVALLRDDRGAGNEDLFSRLAAVNQRQPGYPAIRGIAVTGSIAGVEELPRRYSDLRDAVPAFFYASGVVRVPVTWQIASRLELDYALLDGYIDRLDLEGVSSHVLDLLENQVQVAPRPQPHVLKSVVSEALFHTVKRLSEIGIGSDEINEMRFGHLVAVEESRSYQQLRLTVEQIFSGLEIAAKGMRGKYNSPVVKQVRKYIHSNYRSDISLDELADRFSMNKTYLSHLFKRQTGTSVVNFIAQSRVESAKELLRSSSQSIYEIAASVGFEDANYFAKVFKKVTGTAPTEYRKIFYENS